VAVLVKWNGKSGVPVFELAAVRQESRPARSRDPNHPPTRPPTSCFLLWAMHTGNPAWQSQDPLSLTQPMPFVPVEISALHART
jgi:hypothetical protein